MYKKIGKKSQVSLFIIIGLMILAAGGFFIYLYTAREVEVKPVIEEVPIEAQPIKKFVDECVYKLGKEAVIKIGEHGGYIEPNNPLYSERRFETKLDKPTEADGLLLSVSDQNSIIPYWFYLKGKNDCADCIISTANIPTSGQIETQIEKYIDLNIDNCLDEFKNFKEQGFGIDKKNQKTRVDIARKNVAILVDMPLDISRGDEKTKISKFYSEIDVDLMKIYIMALGTTNVESNAQFLEYILMHWISSFSGFDESLLPPIMEMEESFSVKSWVKSLSELRLKEIIQWGVPNIKINGTANAERPETTTDIEKNLYNVMFLDFYNQSFPDITIDFEYFNWPIYFQVTPNRGEILEPYVTFKQEFMKYFFPPVQTNAYRFYYDVSYPLIVEIRDYGAFNEEGYSFFFGLETNVRDNKNILEWYRGQGTIGSFNGVLENVDSPEVPPSQVDVEGDELLPDISQIPGADQIEGLEQPEFEPQTVNVSEGMEEGAIKKSLFCDPRQRLSGNITIITKNSKDSAPLDAVAISYACGEYDACPAGQTSLNDQETIASATDTFPICIGGFLSLEKEGFLKKIVPLNTSVGIQNKVEKKLEPIRVKKTKLQKYVIDRVSVNVVFDNSYQNVTGPGSCRPNLTICNPTRNWAINSTAHLTIKTEPEDISSSEQVMLTIKKLKENPLEEDFTQTLMFEGKSLGGELKLIPGIYEIESMFVDYAKHTIYPQAMETGQEEPMYIPEQPQEFNGLMLGGVVLNNNTGYWNVTKEDLDGDNSFILFSVIKTPKPTKMEHFEEMGKTENYSMTYREFVEPMFLKE